MSLPYPKRAKWRMEGEEEPAPTPLEKAAEQLPEKDSESTQESLIHLAEDHLSNREKRHAESALFQSRVIRIMLSMERRIQEQTEERRRQDKKDTIYAWVFCCLMVAGFAYALFMIFGVR